MNLSMLEIKKVQRLNWIKLLFFLSILITFSFFLIKVNNMFISVLLAAVLSQLLRPLVDIIEIKIGVNRFISTLFVFLVIGFIIGIFFIYAFPFIGNQLQNFENELNNYMSGTKKLFYSLDTKIKTHIPYLKNYNLTSKIQTLLSHHTNQWVKEIPVVLTNSFSVFLLCPFLAFFMIKDSHSILKGFLALVPNHVFYTTLSLTHEITQQIGKFIRVRILEAFIVGIITILGLHIISFPFALLLGVFAGLMNLIPYLGPIIGILPALLIGFVNNYGAIDFSYVIAIYVIAQLIDNAVLIPFMVARMMKLHPVTVVVLVTAGAQFFGILGMIISIPVANAIQVSYQAIYQHMIDTESTK